MPVSCGAILYTIRDGIPLILLGLEGKTWMPFKGGPLKGESYIDAMRREIFEETCGMVLIGEPSEIKQFKTKSKTYYLCAVEVPYDIVYKFRAFKKQISKLKYEFHEKQDIKFFTLEEIENHHPLVIKIVSAFQPFKGGSVVDLQPIDSVKNLSDIC